MSKKIVLSKTEVDPSWINYVKIESDALSRFDDYEIENYADRELYNPDMQELLLSIDDIDSENFDTSSFTISFAEENLAKSLGSMKAKFLRLKGRIRKIICEVFAGFGSGPIPSWEDIIRAILLAIAGSIFAGVMGALLLPIVIAIIAKIIRRGIENVCPV
jgi:hypothetical protein